MHIVLVLRRAESPYVRAVADPTMFDGQLSPGQLRFSLLNEGVKVGSPITMRLHHSTAREQDDATEAPRVG